MALSQQQLRALAFQGAQVTYQKLQTEMTTLERSFPALKNGHLRTPKRSAKSLRAQSLKMKKLWAERKKAQAKKA
jgi:exonuclease VII small subunit